MPSGRTTACRHHFGRLRRCAIYCGIHRHHFHILIVADSCLGFCQETMLGVDSCSSERAYWRGPLGLTGLKILDKGAFHLALSGQSQDYAVLLLLDLIRILQFAFGLSPQLMDFTDHALRVLWVFIVSELLLGKSTRLRPRFKPCEQKCIRTEIEELVLSLSRILVHWFPDDREVNKRVLQILVILVVPVREDQQLNQLDKDEVRLFA